MLRQFLVDDKGIVLIGALGTPTFTHNSNPARAVASSLEIVRVLGAIGLNAPIGVTTGQAFCGTVGCWQRQEYAMVGHVVNLAAKIMVSLKKQAGARCDKETASKCKGVKYLKLRASEGMTIKGLDEKVQTYNATGVYGKYQHEILYKKREPIPLIGRVEMKATIQKWLSDFSKAGMSTAILIEGKAGYGKTLLMDFVEEQAVLLNVHVNRAAPTELAASEPYMVFKEILANMLGLCIIDGNPVQEYDHVLNFVSQLKYRLLDDGGREKYLEEVFFQQHFRRSL